MSQNIKTFEKLLKAFTDATKTSMDAALELSHMAIKQFEQSGDVGVNSFAQRFLNAQNKNYNRIDAYLNWMKAHSPLQVDGSLKDGYTLSKDKDKAKKAEAEGRDPFNMEGALAKPYWEFNKPTEGVVFGTSDVIKALKSALKKFGSDNQKAYGELAEMAVVKATAAVVHLEAELAADVVTEAAQKREDEIAKLAAEQEAEDEADTPDPIETEAVDDDEEAAEDAIPEETPEVDLEPDVLPAEEGEEDDPIAAVG